MRKLLALLSLLPSLAHGAITYVGAGTGATGIDGADLSPSLHASTAEGNAVLVLAAQKNTSAAATAAGYTELATIQGASGGPRLTLLCKIAGAGETAPSVVFSDNTAGNSTLAHTATFAGTQASCTDIVAHSATSDNASSTAITTPALPIATANTLVIAAGFRENHWNTDDIAVLDAGWAEIGQVERTASQTMASVWDYIIQTTATNISADSYGCSTCGATVSVSIVLSIKSAVVAPTFSVAPAIGTRTTSTIPVTATTACTDCNYYGVAQGDGVAAPTCTQIKAGQDGTGSAAYKAFGPVAMTATVQNTGTFSTYTDGTIRDGYFCLNSTANGDSAVSAIADMYKKPAFSVAPTISAQDTNDYTVTKTLDGAGSCTAVACLKDSAAPSVAQTLAGNCTGDVAAIATVTDASCEAGTATLGGALTRPIHDVYVAATYGSQNSDLTTLADEMLDAPTNFQHVLLASVSATSWCNDFNTTATPDIAAGDVLQISTATSPSAYAWTQGTDCDGTYTDPNGSRQTLTYQVYDLSVDAFMTGGPGTLWFNNSAPIASNGGTYDTGNNLIDGVAMAAIESDRLFDDADGDALTCTSSDTGTGTGADKRPAGTTYAANDLTGTPTSTGITTGSMTWTCTDPPGDSATTAVTWTVYDQVSVPDCDGIDAASCSSLAGALNLSVSVTAFECSNLVQANGVISQSPVASTSVNPFTVITVTASNGACTGISLWTTTFLDDSTAVPSTAVKVAGVALAQDGTRYVAAVPGSGVTFSQSGLKYRSDGALVISTSGSITHYVRGIGLTATGEVKAAVCSPDYVVAGVPMDPDGTVCMSDVD